jgi:hypothetical protein
MFGKKSPVWKIAKMKKNGLDVVQQGHELDLRQVSV